jgi:hypothetical protein
MCFAVQMGLLLARAASDFRCKGFSPHRILHVFFLEGLQAECRTCVL